MSEVKEYYDQYTTRQLSAGINRRHSSIINWLKEFGIKSTDKVLEIGCGIGTVTYLLSDCVKEGKITALDISPQSIELAKGYLKDCNNVEFLAGDIIEDAIEHKIDEQYDVIVLPDVLEHIPIKLHHTLFEKLSAKLKDDGFILIHIPNPYYLAWCHDNKPELLQIIDQPIYTDRLLQEVYAHGLYLYHLNTYSLWVEQHDYQVLVLKKSVNANVFTNLKAPEIPVHKKALNKISRLFKPKK